MAQILRRSVGELLLCAMVEGRAFQNAIPAQTGVSRPSAAQRNGRQSCRPAQGAGVLGNGRLRVVSRQRVQPVSGGRGGNPPGVGKKAVAFFDQTPPFARGRGVIGTSLNV